MEKTLEWRIFDCFKAIIIPNRQTIPSAHRSELFCCSMLLPKCGIAWRNDDFTASVSTYPTEMLLSLLNPEPFSPFSPQGPDRVHWGTFQTQDFGLSHFDWIPIGSMYAIYGNIYHQYTPNVSIYTIHGWYGIERCSAHFSVTCIAIGIFRSRPGNSSECPHFDVLRSMAISGTDWLEVPIPYIFGLFFRPKFQEISPQFRNGLKDGVS